MVVYVNNMIHEAPHWHKNMLCYGNGYILIVLLHSNIKRINNKLLWVSQAIHCVLSRRSSRCRTTIKIVSLLTMLGIVRRPHVSLLIHCERWIIYNKCSVLTLVMTLESCTNTMAFPLGRTNAKFPFIDNTKFDRIVHKIVWPSDLHEVFL